MVGESITEILLQADARGEPLGPAALTFLVRRYAAGGGDDVRRALERGLTGVLDGVAAGEREPAWIPMLCEAAAVTDDARVGDAVAALSRALREAWPYRGPMLDAMHGIDACLAAAMFLSGGWPDGRDLVAGAVDELERVVSLAYRPGESLPRSLRNPDEPDGGLEEHVAAAAALLTAHDLTARLPYSMLAEELIQPVRRSTDEPGVAARCALARVLGRLARLHDDEEYVRAAIVAPSSDYRAEARIVLDGVAPLAARHSEHAALLGVAMGEIAHAS